MARTSLAEGAPYVSIQRVGGDEDDKRHLAWGALISQDVVVVDLAEWPAEGRLEVLLASDTGGGPVVERIAMAKVEIVGIEDRPEATLAAVRLAHESRQAPTKAEFDLKQTVSEIDGKGDIWSALERLGYVPEGVRELDTRKVLGQVAEWERLLRDVLVVDRRPARLDEVGLRICCFWRCNQCHFPF